MDDWLAAFESVQSSGGAPGVQRLQMQQLAAVKSLLQGWVRATGCYRGFQGFWGLVRAVSPINRSLLQGWVRALWH